MMYDGSAMPQCPDCPPPGPIEQFLAVMLACGIFFLLLILILPEKWGDRLWNLAFPFAPRRK